MEEAAIDSIAALL
jgi:3-methyladenine DNA glycosylase AlkD